MKTYLDNKERGYMLAHHEEESEFTGVMKGHRFT